MEPNFHSMFFEGSSEQKRASAQAAAEAEAKVLNTTVAGPRQGGRRTTEYRVVTLGEYVWLQKDAALANRSD